MNSKIVEHKPSPEELEVFEAIKDAVANCIEEHPNLQAWSIMAMFGQAAGAMIGAYPPEHQTALRDTLVFNTDHALKRRQQ